MFETIIRFILTCLLRLRYSLTVTGLDTIKKLKGKGILFLPNHPALIDPVIIMSLLHKSFKPRPLGDEAQTNRPFIRQIMKHLRPVIIPDMEKSDRSKSEQIRSAMKDIVSALKGGDNVLIYPSGHIYRSHLEDVGGNGIVDHILKEIPDIKIVLVRTRGLWGSSFSYAKGKAPSVFHDLGKYILSVLSNGIYFVPKRKVTVEFKEPDDIPRLADRLTINQYLENFYNHDPLPNTYVPYYWWEGKKQKILPEPEVNKIIGDPSLVPSETKKIVAGYLTNMTGISKINDNDRLSHELGIDSLKMVELMGWIENEFGFPIDDVGALKTAGDCYLAACGQIIGKKTETLKPLPSAWFKDNSRTLLSISGGKSIPDLFLSQARINPGKIILSDQISGTKTYRELITAVMVLKPVLENLPGDVIGIMLPASVSAAIVYLAAIFSGKTPVMINWTVGTTFMQHCLNTSSVTHVITAKALLEKLKNQGLDYSSIDVNWIELENIVKNISIFQKASAFIKSRLSFSSLSKSKISDTAAILFTSGSEAKPKAVPLSHHNFISNLKDFSTTLHFYSNDRLLGMLPPFHSLGLAGTIIMPLCIGLKTVYHPNPTEAVSLVGLIRAYKVSLLLGTPTFINGIIKAAKAKDLATIRLVFTGAEKCPDHIYDLFNQTCPEAVMCEGYGITECSPVVSVNSDKNPVPGTIGKILPSMEYVIIHPENSARIPVGEQGLLLVKGPNVFAGYLKGEAKSPFVDFEGEKYFDTGDLVKEDMNGILTFCGRLKRFIKLGGEMISLPAIENVLMNALSDKSEEGPVLAVEATLSEYHPEVVLFITRDLEREEINNIIRQSGLSGLHNVRKVVKLDKIPVLGSGKTDYQSLKNILKESG
ncbi:MAG: AMP-binding protein [Proteobacteria bacterium]|nr:AMP-binding protein [Pseudomonadota bacterium]